MEEVYTGVQAVSCAPFGDGTQFNCIFRGRPGENATEDPGPTGKTAVQMEDVHFSFKGGHTATDHEGELVGVEWHVEDGEGACLVSRERSRIRCGEDLAEFDEMDGSYIRRYR